MARLVLTRKIDEAVVIHDDGTIIATITVNRIDRNQIRLAFVAEESVSIDRQEVFDAGRKKIEQQY